jgi:hypothetical protein
MIGLFDEKQAGFRLPGEEKSATLRFERASKIYDVAG